MAPAPLARLIISTPILTAVALTAFAGNSLLCRLALRDGLIDPISFTQLRLGAGALALLPILVMKPSVRPSLSLARDWRPATALFVYALGFSLAYVGLGVGAGALILFGTVQIAMVGLGLARGDRPGPLGWLGLATAFAGLVWLVAPGLSAPPLWAAALMAVAGLAWGVYSVMGMGEADPIHATARNFALSLPAVLALFAVHPAARHIEARGLELALASGVLASALGYVLWYRALKGLSHLAASVGQLVVPVLATAAGALWLGEGLNWRIAGAAAAILAGIALAIGARSRPA